LVTGQSVSLSGCICANTVKKVFVLTQSNSSQFRADVQVLRAIAVLLVIFFHAKVPGFQGGYLGVDIFFVISGYWMSLILIKDLESGDFSFSRFYERRLRRILPALYATLFLVLAISWIELWPKDFDTMSEVLGSAVLFLANAVIRNQASDYFAPELDAHPLLHIWSLSLEEQFYLVFPVIMLLLFKAPRLIERILISLIPLLSFYWAISFYEINPTASFYHLPTRVWEFWLGFIAARFYKDRLIQNQLIYWFGCILSLSSVALASESSIVPGWGSLGAVLGTAFVLASYSTQETKSASYLKTFVWIGGISYSLYLLHQPVLSFARLRGIESWSLLLPITLSIGVFGAHYLKVLVEDRFRDASRISTKKFSFVAIFGGLILILFAYFGVKTNGAPGRFDGVEEAIVSTAIGSPKRKYCFNKRDVDSICSHGDGPVTTAVLGDSHSIALSYAIGELLKEKKQSALEMSISGCGIYSREDECIAWYKSVLDYLIHKEEIKTVFISMRIASQMHGKHDGLWPKIPNLTTKEHRASLKSAYKSYFEKLSQSGKKVIWVLQVPEVGERLELLMKEAVDDPLASSVSVSVDWWNRRMSEVRDFAMTLPGNIQVYDPQDLFCGQENCYAIKSGVTLYRDSNHMSLAAARLIAKTLDEQFNRKRD